MALRIPNIVGKSSQICAQSRRLKFLSITSNSGARSIMTSLTKMEKALEQLKSNPFFDKYAKNIARLQETSPEELLSRLQEREKKTAQQKEKRELEQKFQEKCEAKPFVDPSTGTKKSLNDIMKLDLIQDKGKDEIVEIWINYHKVKDCICGAMDTKQFEKMFERGRKHLTFLLPLPRENGYEFIVCQFNGTEIHMTPLIWYQTHKENAPECLTMIHYQDLKDSKGIVLMRGEFDSKSMTAQEAQCLANELQLYYCTDDPARIKLIETFTDKPDEFKHMDLIAQLESISLNGAMPKNVSQETKSSV